MEKWNFKVKSSPKGISKNIESALKSVNGLVINMNYNKNQSITISALYYSKSDTESFGIGLEQMFHFSGNKTFKRISC
jgi:hypothetical protein